MAADLTRRREEAATCLQRHFRGYTVRSKLKQLQKNFEEIVHELDGHDFHVVWPSNKELLSLPLLVTKYEDRPENREVEDRTLTQNVCDISALNPRNHQTRLQDISDSPDHLFPDHIKRNLEQNFAETIPDKERNSMHSSKTTPTDNDTSHVQVGEDNDVNHPGAGENDNTRSDKDIKVHHQGGHGTMINGSPHPVDEQMYTRHSTPVSSGGTEHNDRATRRHPLLTDSWMTDKSFDAVVSDDSTISNKDLQQKREQIGMELLWNQQAIESRKNYLRLKKHMTSTDNESR